MKTDSLTALFTAQVTTKLEAQKKLDKDAQAFERLVAEQDAMRAPRDFRAGDMAAPKDANDGNVSDQRGSPGT